MVKDNEKELSKKLERNEKILIGVIVGVASIFLLVFLISVVWGVILAAEEVQLIQILESNNSDNCQVLFEKTRNKCYLAMAKQLNDPELCEQITDSGLQEQGSCYIAMTREFRDFSYCNKVMDEEKKNDCIIAYEQLTLNDYTYCVQVTDACDRDRCYMYEAHTNYDEPCYEVQNPDFQNYCLYFVYRDTRYCSAIADDDIKSDCFEGKISFQRCD